MPDPATDHIFRVVPVHGGNAVIVQHGLHKLDAVARQVIPSLDSVVRLHLYVSDISDEAMRLILCRHHESLRDLHLSQTEISDFGLEDLARCTALEILQLNRTRITDRTLTAISSLCSLKRIWLNDTFVTDAGVDALSRTKSPIDFIVLIGCEVTNEGLLMLGQIKTLKAVMIAKTTVTASGVKQFRSLFPDVEVDTTTVS